MQKMNKGKIAIIVISGILLVSGIVAMLLLFLLPSKKTVLPQEFTLSASNISVDVGSVVALPYSCSIEDAVITFESSDPSVARIVSSRLLGVSAGETTVTITATYEGMTRTANLTVVVNDLYSIIILSSTNCCFVAYSFVNSLKNPVANFDITISSYEITFIKMASSLILTSHTSGSITFSCESLSFSQTFISKLRIAYFTMVATCCPSVLV